MSELLPQDRYRALASKLRNRIEFAEFVLTSKTPASQMVETVALQGRMAIETIAYMSLVATEHGIGRSSLPRDAKKHWNAEKIFWRLKAKELNILPSPSRMVRSSDARFTAIFEGVPEYRLSYTDLIDMYRQFHEGLHAPNPYVQSDDSAFYNRLIPTLRANITRIKKFTWVHFIGIKGQGFAVHLRNTHGVTALIPLSKIAEIPEDLCDDYPVVDD